MNMRSYLAVVKLLWHQWSEDLPLNDMSDWDGEYGDTRSPLLHTKVCILIKPAAMDKLITVPTENHML